MEPPLPEIDFRRIRTHQGTQHGGFEELCVQLFRSRLTDEAEFTRVEGAGGDGGVEAIAKLRKGTEVGLQAKYFDKLDSKRWRQIDQSIRAALRNYPALVEYHVAVPLDRTPAQRKTWAEHVERWQKIKRKPRRAVCFKWLGRSEIEDALTTREHRDKLLYWFGCRQFSAEWMDRHNAAAIQDLDCRYTPKCHVRTESEKLLDAFALNPEFIAEYYRTVGRVFTAGRELVEQHSRDERLQRFAAGECVEYESALQKSKGEFGDGKNLPRFKAVLEASQVLGAVTDRLKERIVELKCQEKPPNARAEQVPCEGPYDYSLTLVRSAEAALYQLRCFIERYACADVQNLLVTGDAGSGKSHLLASAVLEARKRGRPAILLLGEHFLTAAEPWSQLTAKLGWEGAVSELLAALNHSAEVCGWPALVCIDALNESSERLLWRSHLNGFSKRLEGFGKVRLVVSCRSDFVPITMPDSIAKPTDGSWARCEHTGFGEAIFEAVARFFGDYRVQADHFPPLLEEFRNPLFLKTLCEAFEDLRIPVGPITLDLVMKRRVAKVCEAVLKAIDCPEGTTRRAIELVAQSVEATGNLRVPRDILRPQVDALFPVGGESRSLYRHLRSNGLLVEVGTCGEEAGARVEVRFPYERFSEYFIADRMLRRFSTAVEIRRAWTRNGMLAQSISPHRCHLSPGFMKVLAILLPERFGIEFAGLFNGSQLSRDLLQDFLNSLAWRSPGSFTKESRRLLGISEGVGLRRFLEALLRVATIPGHPFNADFLHRCLSRMKVAERDAAWTIEVSRLAVWDGGGMPDLLVRWAFRVPIQLVSDDQALLVARTLAWFFSSNRRGFRFRATLAAIRLLQGRCAVTARMLRDFSGCNDAYVTERVFAVACGVAMREFSAERLQELATVVFELVFSGPLVPADILVRDYACCILELCLHRGCLPGHISPEQFRPPYRSRWPRIWSENRIASLETDKGWCEIRESVQPNCPGWYGDFGRYVMQAAVEKFSACPLRRRSIKGGSVAFDAMTARRWVLQRVKQLGWTPTVFCDYERRLPSKGRQSVYTEERRLERISKKYQWIAIRELQAFLSDHYHLALDRGEAKPEAFRGAWQFWARDFDPSQPLKDLADEGEEAADDASPPECPWWNRYVDHFPNQPTTSDREAWVTRAPDDLRALIELPSAPDHDGAFLSLAGYYRWKEELPFNKDERDLGHLEMWAHVRSWLVPRKSAEAFLSQVKAVHFLGHGCRLVEISRGWLGEYPWGAPFHSLRGSCLSRDDWIRGVSIPAIQAVCCQEEGVWGILPSPQLCDILEASWAGRDFEFANAAGTLVAYSPFAGRRLRTPPCLVARSEFIKALRREGWEIVWAVAGERFCFSSKSHRHMVAKNAEFSAVYHLSGNEVAGGLAHHVIRPVPRPQA